MRALDFVDTREIVDEFARSIRQELDYRQEGRNAQAFHRNFAGHPHVVVPARLLELHEPARADARVPRRRPARRPRGRRLDDRAAPPPRLRHRRDLADDDLPPRLLPRRPASGEHPRALARADRARRLRARREADRPRPLEADARSSSTRRTRTSRRSRGGSPTSASATRRRGRTEFVSELHTIYSRYYGSSLKEIDPLQVIREAFGLIYTMNLRLPSRFVMLDKAIATIGSVGVELYPDFNVFEVAQPYARALDARAVHPAPRRRPGAPRGQAVRPGDLGAARTRSTRRSSRCGRARSRSASSTRGSTTSCTSSTSISNRLVIALDRRRRADRVEPDRDLREDRAARPRPERRLGARLHRLRRARHLAALGRDPLRPTLRRARGRLTATGGSRPGTARGDLPDG